MDFAPTVVDGHRIEGAWRAHQVPLARVKTNPQHLKLLAEWMLGYGPAKLFDAEGKLMPHLKALVPTGKQRMGSNPHADGGLLKKNLSLPDFRKYGIEVPLPAQMHCENTYPLGVFLRGVMQANMQTFRVLDRMKIHPINFQLSTKLAKSAGKRHFYQKIATD